MTTKNTTGKGKVKQLVSPWKPILINRNGIALTFEATELGRGEGKYAGLAIKESDKLEHLITWTAKNQDIANDSVIATQFFLGKLADLYNNAIFRSAWRLAAEEKAGNVSDNDKLTDSQKLEIEAEFVANVTRFFNEDSSRQITKDSSYYVRQALTVQNNIKPYLQKAKGDIKNLSADEVTKLRQLQSEKKAFEQKADELRRAELAALEAGIDDIDLLLGDDSAIDSTTESTN